MFEGNVYAITALVSAVVCFAVLKCNNRIYEKSNVIRGYFSFMLIIFIGYDLVEALWGFMSTGAIDLGGHVFNAATFLIHFSIIVAVACWCMFLTNYFGFRETRMIMILQCIPLAAAVVILITQIIGHTVYYFDADGVYHTGPFRIYLFIIRFTYLAISIAKIVFFLIKHKGENDWRYTRLVIECALMPVVFETLQCLYPDGPYSTMGIMISVVFLFNGMMVIEKIRNSQRYETISREMYMTLEALSENYVSIILIDLERDDITPIKSTPYADNLIEPDMPVRDAILKVFRGAATDEFTEEMQEFADINLLPAKMINRRSLSTKYCSRGLGWCVATFMAAERDDMRNLKKIVLAVQSVDEQHKKEQEYEDALSRAYRNENAILGELIKMQSVGVMAVDEQCRIIVANDAVLSMFENEGIDPIGMSVHDFFGDKDLKIPENAGQMYDDVMENGGGFNYQLVVYPKQENKETCYLMAEVRRVDLLDNTKITVTCYSDITTGKLLEEKLRILSETDSLTGIANRRCGESQIKLLLQERVPGIFCLFDVNGFKQINDTYGHQTGDDTLVAVAKAIKASFRGDDIFMRLGGDEFAIYMRGVATADLAKIRIARLFENIARIEMENVPKGSVTISLGAVIVTQTDNETIQYEYESIYRRADENMYKCKDKPGSNMSIEGVE